MKYTTNGLWSDSTFPKTGWSKVCVMRDTLGRPCECLCGRTPKYLHKMQNPNYRTLLVGCTCHAQLLGVPYADAKAFENAYKKEEKIRIRLEKQKLELEKHELAVINGGVCPLGYRCPTCRTKLKEQTALDMEAERKADEASEEDKARAKRERIQDNEQSRLTRLEDLRRERVVQWSKEEGTQGKSYTEWDALKEAKRLIWDNDYCYSSNQPYVYLKAQCECGDEQWLEIEAKANQSVQW